MSHFYSGRHIHSSRAGAQDKIPYQRSLPQFDLNSRVKLPPIIKNELLTGRDRNSTLQPTTCRTLSTSVSFPQIVETQSASWKSNRNGTSPQQIKSANKRAPVRTVNHIEKSPIHFPSSYAVLPPIGQTSSWPYGGRVSNLPATPRNGEQAPIIVPDQARGRRRRSSQRKRSENGLSPTLENVRGNRGPQTEGIKNLPDTTASTESNSIAVDHGCQKHLLLPDTNTYPKQTTDEQINAPNDAAGLSLNSDQVEISECDPRHVLEKLELSKEAEEFLGSKNSQRRGARCIEIDPSLKTAVDIIRDNLLRQTMEELCMMW